MRGRLSDFDFEDAVRRLTLVNFAFLVWASAGGWLLLKAQ